MSAGAVFQQAMRVVGRASLQEADERDVLRTLEAGRSGPLAFAYDAGVEAGLTRDAVLARSAAVFFLFAAANLADDIADGDCTYLDAPTRKGPAVQFVLQNLASQVIAEQAISPVVVSRIAADLVAVGGAQLVELRTTTWTANVTREVADAIAGLQYSAYLRILWAGTGLEPRAPHIGRALGSAAHIARDLLSSDVRIDSLARDDRRAIVRWAFDLVRDLRAEGLACIDASLRTIGPTLESALAR